MSILFLRCAVRDSAAAVRAAFVPLSASEPQPATASEDNGNARCFIQIKNVALLLLTAPCVSHNKGRPAAVSNDDEMRRAPLARCSFYDSRSGSFSLSLHCSRSLASKAHTHTPLTHNTAARPCTLFPLAVNYHTDEAATARFACENDAKNCAAILH